MDKHDIEKAADAAVESIQSLISTAEEDRIRVAYLMGFEDAARLAEDGLDISAILE